MRSLPNLKNKKLFFLIALMIIAVMSGWVLFSKPLYSLTIKTSGSDYNLRVELADTDKEREIGLMNRTSLSPDKGMLFIFPKEQSVSFWMKNTLIPLDMLFIKADGRIDFIHHNAHPEDETPITAPGPELAVLEIAGGQAMKHGIKVGDIVKTPLLSGQNQ